MKIVICKVTKPIHEGSYETVSKDWKVGDIIKLTAERAKALKDSVKVVNELKRTPEQIKRDKEKEEAKKKAEAERKTIEDAKNKMIIEAANKRIKGNE